MKDAKAFADSMKKAAAGLYGEVRVTLRSTRRRPATTSTRSSTKIAARDPPARYLHPLRRRPRHSENGRFYLIPQDYQGGANPAALAARAIDQDRLQDWLANRIKAKRAIILLDTCESGRWSAGMRARAPTRRPPRPPSAACTRRPAGRC